MSELYAECPHYEALIVALCARAAQVQRSYSDLDKIANLAAGAVAKALGPSQTKKLGHLSMFSLPWALGLKIVLVEDPEAAAQVIDLANDRKANQARPNNYAVPPSKRVKARVLRHLAQRGGDAYKRKTTKKLRAALARHAAMCRHYPHRVFDWNEIKRAAKP